MKNSRTVIPVLAVLVAFAAGGTAHGQAPAVPAPPKPTLWNFLGIPQGCNKIHAQLFNRRGNHPGLEKKPPLRPIADPLNLLSDVPAIKAAAEVKQAEDLAPQKIKAIKYLATIGCGCYDKDGKITEALIAATEDCTEEVRLAAVEAITEAAQGKQCGQCHANCCCGEKIVEQLAKIAYERDELGCWIEPSERVRNAAIEALAACCPNRLPAVPVFEEGVETPPPSGIELPPDAPPAPPTQATPPPAPTTLQPIPSGDAQARSSRRRYQASFAAATTPAPVREPQTVRPQPLDGSMHVNVVQAVRGVVAEVDAANGIAHLHLADNQQLAPGARVKVYHEYLTGRAQATELRVLDSRPGMANARAVDYSQLSKIAKGDEVVGLK